MRKQNASALISALFITALVAMAATSMSRSIQLDIHRTRILVERDQLYLASQAVGFWAMASLAVKDLNLGQADAEGRVLSYPKTQQLVPGIQLEGGLYDLQAKFNFNNILDLHYISQFKRLLNRALAVESPNRANQLMLAGIHWISQYQLDRGMDSLTQYYAKLNPAYQVAHQAMHSITELRLIQGVNAKEYRALAGYFCALPKIAPLNINSANEALLATLGNGLNSSQLQRLIEARKQPGGIDLRKLNTFLREFHIPAEQVTLESNYFLVKALASQGEQQLLHYFILERRQDQDKTLRVHLIQDSLNQL